MADLNQTNWSETDSLNDQAAPLGWTSGSMLPSQTEPTARAMMGATKRWYDQLNATVTSAGTANAQTLTHTVARAQLVAGDRVAFMVGAGLTNTGPATINIDALGALNVKQNGTALAGGELVAGYVAEVEYDGTNLQLLATSAAAIASPAPNLLINGAQEIDQANEGGSVALSSSAAGSYVTDGWKAVYTNATAVVSAQRVADAPAGLTYSLKATVSAGAAVGVGDFLLFAQLLDGYALTDTAIGTASARQLWLSFWVKSSIAPYTMSGTLTNAANNRSYPFAVAINNAGVWERKWVAIPADTAGTWITSGNALAARLFLVAAAGSTWQGTAAAWQAGSFFGTTANTNTILSTTGATFQITGTKLEIGPAPTRYLRRDPVAELALCQRRFEKSYAPGFAIGASTSADIAMLRIAAGGTIAGRSESFKVTKPTQPTMTFYSPATGDSGKALDFIAGTDVVATINHVGVNAFDWFATPAAAGTNVYLGLHWTADSRL